MAKKISGLVNKEGNPQLRTIGLKRDVFSDLYHHFLVKPWIVVLITIIGMFLTVNLVFTLFYMECNGIKNASTIHDYFFFSIQTLSTIGYGYMYPVNFCAHSLVAIQSFLGILFISFLTGLVFAKFSLPRAKVIFTEKAVINNEGGKLSLKFRMTNKRFNQIVNAQVKAYLLKFEYSDNGSRFRRINDMKLIRSNIPLFSLTITIQHIIDEQSPFYNETYESLIEKQGIVILTITGLDETISQTIHSRHTYTIDDIAWNYKYKDIILTDENNEMFIDYKYFNELEPL